MTREIRRQRRRAHLDNERLTLAVIDMWAPRRPWIERHAGALMLAGAVLALALSGWWS